jgi:hypothetical protein
MERQQRALCINYLISRNRSTLSRDSNLPVCSELSCLNLENTLGSVNYPTVFEVRLLRKYIVSNPRHCHVICELKWFYGMEYPCSFVIHIFSISNVCFSDQNRQCVNEWIKSIKQTSARYKLRVKRSGQDLFECSIPIRWSHKSPEILCSVSHYLIFNLFKLWREFSIVTYCVVQLPFSCSS